MSTSFLPLQIDQSPKASHSQMIHKTPRLSKHEQQSHVFIAELGSGFENSLSHAKELSHAAIDSGAHIIKTQCLFARELLSKKAGKLALGKNKVTLYRYFKRQEKKLWFYKQLSEYVHTQGAQFLSSVFGLKSLAQYLSLKPQAIKIASPEINHLHLLHAIADTPLTVYVSLGLAQDIDIIRCLAQLAKPERTIYLMHCVTAYPSHESQYNLARISYLKHQFMHPVGLSDHSTHELFIPSLAHALGSRITEKHFYLRYNRTKIDNSVNCTPAQFRAMVNYIQNLETQPKDEHMRMLTHDFGKERIQVAIGSNTQLNALPSYADTSKRSICSTRHIAKNGIFTPKNIDVLRVEKNLNPGLIPQYFDHILGTKADRAIPAGTPITKEYLRQALPAISNNTNNY